MSAWSPDRVWWFDGRSWVRVRPPRIALSVSRADWALGVAWLVVCVLGVVMTASVNQQAGAGQDSGPALTGLLVIAGLVVVALPVRGYLLGRRREWLRLAVSALYVWLLLMVGYGAAMLTSPASGGSDDDTAAAAGLAILGVPSFFVVAALIAIGAGAAALTAWFTRRMRGRQPGRASADVPRAR